MYVQELVFFEEQTSNSSSVLLDEPCESLRSPKSGLQEDGDLPTPIWILSQVLLLAMSTFSIPSTGVFEAKLSTTCYESSARGGKLLTVNL